jgi:hypothetical protein
VPWRQPALQDQQNQIIQNNVLDDVAAVTTDLMAQMMHSTTGILVPMKGRHNESHLSAQG